LLSEGRSALPRQDYATAISSYQQVLDVEPDNVEARTYLGWVLANSAQVLPDPAEKASTFESGKQTLEEAIAIDPTYADSYCFLAIIAAQFDNDLDTAETRQGECLAHDPSSEMVGLVNGLVAPLLASPPSTAPASPASPAVTDPAG
jgi:tetratricopeptide (TPR) repeat protein